MNPVDRPLLDIGLTRLEFLRISGKGLAGLTIAPALLSLLGCKQEDIDSGTVGLIGNDSNLLIVFYVQIMPDDFVMQLHR
ncbi:hypothetical protein MZD73_12560, partial [Escherichia coli]|nr:hypothetical protein [Escherichia coli]